MAEVIFGKGKGGGCRKRKGVKKEDRIFDDILTTQLEQVMCENDKELAKQYRNPKTTQVERSKYWEKVRRRLSVVSGINMDNPRFPDREQIRKKWNYRVSKKRNKSDKEKHKVKLQKLEQRMKRQHASGRGGGPAMSPICDPDGDDMEMDQDFTQKIFIQIQ